MIQVSGRDNTQKVAIEEVIALSASLPKRRQILRLVASWKVRVDMGELEGFVQREEIMTITKAFEAWQQETENRARQDGRQTTEIEIALTMLRKNMDLETIAEVTGLTIAEIANLHSQSS